MMNSFFIINDNQQISIDAQFAGYVVFYKKSKEESVATIQDTLYTKLIENALKLKLAQFLFVDISTNTVRFSALKKVLDIHKCFLFGVKEHEIGVNFDLEPYRLTHVASVDFLKTDAPEVLENDKVLKNKLWTQLQISFKL